MRPPGVVLLHGKWDNTPFAVAPLAAALEAAGHPVRMPTLPWALRRLYDEPLAGAYAVIDAAIASLHSEGCHHHVLCGHSLGAAVALAYAARRHPPSGLILVGPGHFPERLAADGHTTEALAQARAAADPDRRLPLTDVHQGRMRRLRVAPSAYLSYFDPTGDLNWPANARRLSPQVPLLWVVGDRDPARALGMDYAFARSPCHSHDHYLQIDAGHADAPSHAQGPIIDWIRSLPSEP